MNRLNMLARRHWPALGILPPRLTRGAAESTEDWLRKAGAAFFAGAKGVTRRADRNPRRKVRAVPHRADMCPNAARSRSSP